MPQPAADIRRTAFRRATELVAALHLPPGTALAATGSYARRELTAYSDLDLLLICPPGQALDSAVKHQVENLWYPIWDAKIRLDYAVRTPEECANIIADNAVAGLSLLDLTHVAGNPASPSRLENSCYAPGGSPCPATSITSSTSPSPGGGAPGRSSA